MKNLVKIENPTDLFSQKYPFIKKKTKMKVIIMKMIKRMMKINKKNKTKIKMILK